MENKKVVMSLSEILEKKQKLAKSKPIELKAEVKEPIVKSKVIKKDRKKKGVVSVLEAKQEKTNIEKDVSNSALNMNLHKLAKTKETIQPEKPNVITSDNSKIQSDNMKVQLPEVTKPSLSKYTRETDEQIFNKYISQLNNVSGQNRANYLQQIYNMVGDEEYNNLVNKKILLDISSQPFSDIEKLKEYVTKASNNILVISPFDASFVTNLKNIQLEGRGVLCVEESFVVSDYINNLNIPNLTIDNKFPLAFIESYSFVRNILNTDLVYANFRYASPQMVLSLLNLIYGLNEYNQSSSKSIILSSLKNYGDKINIRELILSLPVHTALSMLLGEDYYRNLDKKIYEKYYQLITKASEKSDFTGSGFGDPNYEENIFGGTFAGTTKNPNPAILYNFPDSQIKISSIPLTTKIIYKQNEYYKMGKSVTKSRKNLIEEGKEGATDDIIAIYSDKSLTTRTAPPEESTGSFMEGIGNIISYNQQTGLYTIKNQNDEKVEKKRNYFILAQKAIHEVSSIDKETLANNTIEPEPVQPDLNYTQDELKSVDSIPIPTNADVLEMEDPELVAQLNKANESVDSVVVNPRNIINPITQEDIAQALQPEIMQPETMPTNTPAAVETTAGASPNSNPALEVTPPTVGTNSAIESIKSSSNNGNAEPVPEDANPSRVKDEGLIIEPLDSSSTESSTTESAISEAPATTLEEEERKYLENLINETNKKFKIQSFKKLFETKRYNNPMLYTYLIEL
jgi:hypothetical protein